MATGPQINVHAFLPSAVGADGNIDDPINWRWAHCLTFPLHTLNALHASQKSYKWIRYTIGAVTGAVGILSTSPDLLSPVDDGANLPFESVELYYHTSVEEREQAFPIDPDIARTDITSNPHTDRRTIFRYDVATRDGGNCLLTGAPNNCVAAHLLPHSKGDRYILNYTRRRSRGSIHDVIETIDSIRNRLYLYQGVHAALGVDVAFLMTPNFAMKTNDIDPTASPDEMRCTSHIFRAENAFLLTVYKPGFPLKLTDSLEKPPAILFDAVYAGAILHHFGTQVLKDVVSTAWKNDYYQGKGVTSSAGAEQRKIDDQRAALAAKTQDEVEERTERYGRSEDRKSCRLLDTTPSPSGPDSLDMVMMLPYAFLPANERQAFFMRAREKAEAAEKERLQETVGQWATDVKLEAST